MTLFKRPKPQTPATISDGRCKGTSWRGHRCKLPAGPDGYCGAFHTPAKPGGKP